MTGITTISFLIHHGCEADQDIIDDIRKAASVARSVCIEEALSEGFFLTFTVQEDKLNPLRGVK
jgi:hypothetical protein